jgi:hypothetical protein
MPWIGILLLIGAVGLVGRWAFARTDELGRPEPFPWIGTSILVVMGLAATVPFFQRARLEDTLADAATKIVGSKVTVECQTLGQALVDAGADLGYVRFGPDGTPEARTLIKRQQCADLADYLEADKENPTLDQIVGVHTLTHEAIHMSGVTSESETECQAMGRDADMAVALGASLEAAERLAQAYRTNVYPRMPSGYQSPDCPAG